MKKKQYFCRELWRYQMTQQEIQSIKQRFGIIGTNGQLNRGIEIAVQVAPTDLSVLVTGESGVGKEFFPQIIHAYSRRKHGPYFAVNCGAIPEGTIDSELFGHEKGAFTDAKSDRKGYFEIANGGTLFLDEVGELPLSTQVRLLRVLETGEFIKMGSSQVQKTDVRVVAATNLDMGRAIQEGRFREDLYYRLNTVEIKVPSLRERREDIPLLFRKFAVDFSEKYRMPAVRLNEEAIQLLKSYYWYGNIRQLKNIAEQISIIEQNHDITAETLRKYLPENEAEKSLAVPSNRQAGSDSFMNERELLYKVLFDMKRDMNELKERVAQLSGMPQSGLQSSEVSRTEDYQVAEEVKDEPTSIEDVEKEAIRKALERSEGNRKEAAATLRMSERTLYRKIKEYGLYLVLCMFWVLNGCSVSYKMNGASIDYSRTKTIGIAEFPNMAALVHPPLSAALSDGIRDLFQRQTRLQQTRKSGDLELEGEITGYDLTPMAISADSYASETKLTLTVRVRFTNNVSPDESFEKTYTAYQTFDSSQLLNDVQDQLCTEMIKEISEQIFNDTVAKW